MYVYINSLSTMFYVECSVRRDSVKRWRRTEDEGCLHTAPPSLILHMWYITCGCPCCGVPRCWLPGLLRCSVARAVSNALSLYMLKWNPWLYKYKSEDARRWKRMEWLKSVMWTSQYDYCLERKHKYIECITNLLFYKLENRYLTQF